MKNDNIEFEEAPNDAYKKFFLKFKEIETVAVDQWTVTHLLGFFCKLYQDHYNAEYKFKYNTTAPSKCFEVFQVKKLGQNLSTNPSLLKKYIEWAFKEKVKSAKRKVTSIAFLSHETLVNEYKLKYLAGELKTQKVDRTTAVPQEFSNIIKKYNYSISTYGELAFLLQIEEESISEMSRELSTAGLNIIQIKNIV